MSPPVPPSPPSGPPLGIFFSLLKLARPFPPSPALTSIKTSSMNFIELLYGKKGEDFKLGWFYVYKLP